MGEDRQRGAHDRLEVGKQVEGLLFSAQESARRRQGSVQGRKQQRTFEHRRVGYDIAETQRKMRAVELPKRLILRLEVGW